MSKPSVSKLPIVLSIGSLVVSLISLFLAEKGYEITHRPFIGVFDATPSPLSLDGQFVVVSWEIRMKNVGSIPATITDTDSRIQMTKNGETSHAAGHGEPNKTIFLLPGALTTVGGSMPKSELENVFNGTTKIEHTLKVSYRYSGLLWTLKRHYFAKLQLTALPNQPLSLAIMESEGD